MTAATRLCVALVGIGTSAAQAEGERPLVSGGIYDKPFLSTPNGASLGGYIDGQFRHERVEGLKDEQGFLLERINLFTFAALSERVRVAAEIEFEEGGEEVKLELAIVDFEIHESLSLRAGLILSPLGRFNLAHDSPANELVDRPLVSTQIIPTTLSEPGAGVFGALYPTRRSRVSYELYLVNGLSEGVLSAEGGTFIPGGKGNFEDENGALSTVGRIAVSPVVGAEVAASLHTGPYNRYDIEGSRVDDKRNVSIAALDGDFTYRGFRLSGEIAWASIDVPPETGGIFAESQAGYYVELGTRVLEGKLPHLPDSHVGLTGRWELVDFNSDGTGDDVRRLTLGVNFRPVPDTVFKLDWQRSWERDAFANEENAAAILAGVASYF